MGTAPCRKSNAKAHERDFLPYRVCSLLPREHPQTSPSRSRPFPGKVCRPHAHPHWEDFVFPGRADTEIPVPSSRIPVPKRQRSINLVSIQTPPTFRVILQVSQKKGTRSWYTASHDALRQRPERDGRRSFSRVGHRPCQNRKRSDIHLQTASADR